MSLFNIALTVFLISAGLFFLAVDTVATGFGNLTSVVAGISGIAAGLILIFDRPAR